MLLFVAALAYVTYLGRLSVDDPFEDNGFFESVAPWMLVLVVIAFVWKVFDMVLPTEYLTTITSDRLEFSIQSSKPAFLRSYRVNGCTFSRSSVRYVYTQPYRWYHGDDAFRPLILVTFDDQEMEIDRHFVSAVNQDEFINAIEKGWGVNVYRNLRTEECNELPNERGVAEDS
ncbi:MAG: hypothetical protein AAGA03_11850 [Planctomycetota bacterium]